MSLVEIVIGYGPKWRLRWIGGSKVEIDMMHILLDDETKIEHFGPSSD